MEAVLLEVKGDKAVVSTDVGVIEGKWFSETSICTRRYIIELDCDDIVDICNIKYSKEKISNISNEDTEVVLTGIVGEIEDRVLYLRVLDDIIMLKIKHKDEYEKFINEHVSIKVSGINFFDTGIC